MSNYEAIIDYWKFRNKEFLIGLTLESISDCWEYDAKLDYHKMKIEGMIVAAVSYQDSRGNYYYSIWAEDGEEITSGFTNTCEAGKFICSAVYLNHLKGKKWEM